MTPIFLFKENTSKCKEDAASSLYAQEKKFLKQDAHSKYC